MGEHRGLNLVDWIILAIRDRLKVLKNADLKMPLGDNNLIAKIRPATIGINQSIRSSLWEKIRHGRTEIELADRCQTSPWNIMTVLQYKSYWTERLYNTKELAE